jgi:hypothetical protein
MMSETTTTITTTQSGTAKTGTPAPRRTIRQRIELWLWIRELKKYAKTVRKIDDIFQQYDIPRFERRRFWRDFVAGKDTRDIVNNWITRGMI